MTDPKFQWSIFVNGKDEQFVVRAENYEEFIEAKGQIEKLVTKQALAPETPATDTPTAFAQSLETPVTLLCGIHGTIMVKRSGTYKADVMAKDGVNVWKKAGESYEFWACPTKNANGSYCTFRPKV